MIYSALKTMIPVAVAAVLATVPAFAQESGDAASDLGLNMGTPVDSEQRPFGQPYILEMSGDWEVRCIRTQLSDDPCALHQLLADQDGNSVATIEIVNLPEGQQAAAGATIITPLETLLTQQLTLSVDGGAGKRYPFTFCTEVGCVSRVGFTQGDVDAFRRGNEANLVIVPAGAPDQQVILTVSLAGITAGFERMVELNALNEAAIAAAQAAGDGN